VGPTLQALQNTTDATRLKMVGYSINIVGYQNIGAIPVVRSILKIELVIIYITIQEKTNPMEIILFGLVFNVISTIYGSSVLGFPIV